MISLAMLAIMAGCAVGLYLKGTLAQGIGMIFNALVAGFVAFGFFEIAAKYLVDYAPGMAPWAPMACFLLLLILVFAILQAVELQISKEKIDLGVMPERIGRPLAGVVLGYLATGYLLVAAAMAPLPSAYPYPRFEARNPNPASPKKALLSPDGFVTGLFSTVSKGSFCPLREPKSFAMYHAGYLDQLYLNRQKGKDVPLMTSTMPALEVPRKAGVWNAPDSLRDSEGKPLTGPAGTSLMLVRVGIKKAALKDAAKFTLSQMRLVCGLKGSAGQSAGGPGPGRVPPGLRRLRRDPRTQEPRRDHRHLQGPGRPHLPGPGVSGPDEPDARAAGVQTQQRRAGLGARDRRRRAAADCVQRGRPDDRGERVRRGSSRLRASAGKSAPCLGSDAKGKGRSGVVREERGSVTSARA